MTELKKFFLVCLCITSTTDLTLSSDYSMYLTLPEITKEIQYEKNLMSLDESGKLKYGTVLDTIGSISEKGKLYVINKNMTLTNNVTWTLETGSAVIDNAGWENTKATIITIKHSLEDPITIQSVSDKKQITLGKGIIFDIQSPVIFKNIEFCRSSKNYEKIKNTDNTPYVLNDITSGVFSPYILIRAQTKFDTCNFSGTSFDIFKRFETIGQISYVDCSFSHNNYYYPISVKFKITPLVLIKNGNNTNNVKAVASGNSNILFNQYMLDDPLPESMQYKYLANFPSTGLTAYYAVNFDVHMLLNSNMVWCRSINNVLTNNDLATTKTKILNFLKNTCGASSSMTEDDFKLQLCTYGKVDYTYLTEDLVRKNFGYIDVNIEEQADEENRVTVLYPTTDWIQTILAGKLPVKSVGTAISDVNVGIIGDKDLTVTIPTTVEPAITTVNFSGDLSQYTGTLSFDDSVTDVNVLGDVEQSIYGSNSMTVRLNINGNQNLNIKAKDEQIKQYSIDFFGNLSRHTGKLTFDEQAKTFNVLVSPSNEDNSANVDSNLEGNVNFNKKKTDPTLSSINLNGSLSNFTGSMHVDEKLTIKIKNMPVYQHIHASGNVISFNPNITLTYDENKSGVKFVI